MNFSVKRKKTHKAVVEVEAETRENYFSLFGLFFKREETKHRM